MGLVRVSIEWAKKKHGEMPCFLKKGTSVESPAWRRLLRRFVFDVFHHIAHGLELFGVFVGDFD
jgi:hypothetical protein